jgi:hypothetical protein
MRRLLAIGGGSQSGLWVSMLANALGAAFGAARWGMIAATNAPPASVLRRSQLREGIGPSAVCPDTRIVTGAGYGAFSCAIGELATQAQYRQKVANVG